MSFIALGSAVPGEDAGERGGHVVAMSHDGSHVVLGAPFNDDAGSNRGEARIYKWSGTEWTQVGADIPGAGNSDYTGYSVALNDDGTRVVVGAHGHSSNRGHVRIFDWDGSSWGQVGSDIDGAGGGDQCGYSSSISKDGTRVAIGSRAHASSRGHVRVFEYNGSAWAQMGSDLDGSSTGDKFGYSVHLSSDGSTVAGGGVIHDGSKGHVKVYTWNGSAWAQRGSDIDGEAASDESGYNVALNSDGTSVVIGAPYNDGNGSNSGHTRVYEYNLGSSSWVQKGADIDGSSASDEAGYSVMMSDDGTRIVIGEQLCNEVGTGYGRAYVFEYADGAWTKLKNVNIDGEATNERCGYGVSMSADGSRIAVSSPGHSGGHPNGKGRVRMYQLSRDIPCFLAGTKVSTPDRGHIAIEKLHKDDVVYTPDGRVVPIMSIHVKRVVTDTENSPYCIPRNYFGTHEEVWVSPDHAIATDKGCNTWFIPRVHGAKAGLKRMKPGQEITYYNLTLPNWLTDHFVVGKKMAVESCGERFHRELGLKWPLYRVSETHKTTGLYKRSMGDYTRQKHSLSRGKGSIVEFI